MKEEHGNIKDLSYEDSKASLFLNTVWYLATRPLNLILYGISWFHLYSLCQFGRLHRNVPVLLLCLVWWIGVMVYGFYLWICYSRQKRMHESWDAVSEMKAEDVKWYVRRKDNCLIFLKDKSVVVVNLQECGNDEADFLDLKLSAVNALGKRKYRLAAGILGVVVTLSGSALVVRSAIPYNGKLSWYLDDLKDKRSVILTHDNIYESGVEGIMRDIGAKVKLPETLCLATSFNLHFASDGTIQTLDTMLYGFDENGDFTDSYLITYNAARSKEIDIYLRGAGGAAFDIDKDFRPLVEAVSVMPLRETVAEWSGQESYGILYYGMRDWQSSEGIQYLNHKGEIRSPSAGEDYFSGYSVSVFCPDNEAIMPVRYLYMGYQNFPEEEAGYPADYYPEESGFGSVEKINEYKIAEQSFDVSLEDWGEVTFVSCKPQFQDFEDASFFLIRGDRILYRFPYLREDNNILGYMGTFDNVGAVAFRDIDNDGKKDIIIVTYYCYRAGWADTVPRTGVKIFIAGDNEFHLAEDMMADVTEHIEEQDMYIENICNFVQGRCAGV